MVIEEEILQQTTRVRCNNIPFLVILDFKDIKNCQITRVSEGSDTVTYARLITDRAMWSAAVELKEYIDGKLRLFPVESEIGKLPKGVRRFKGGLIRKYTFKPKPCSICGKQFQPHGSKHKICDACVNEAGI